MSTTTSSESFDSSNAHCLLLLFASFRSFCHNSTKSS